MELEKINEIEQATGVNSKEIFRLDYHGTGFWNPGSHDIFYNSGLHA